MTPRDNNYTVRLQDADGEYTEVDEWFSLKVARKIAGKAYNARCAVVDSPIKAIEIVDIDGNIIQREEF